MANLGGTYRLGDRTVHRMGYGAMQLAGPHAFGPPRDREQAIAVLREAVALGIDHIDTSDYYGPYVVNELIREALAPYPANLTLVTKLGARRDDEGDWLPWNGPADLEQGLRDNMAHLGLDAIEVFHSDHDAAASARYRQRARELGVLMTGGSDFHGEPDHGLTPGAATLPPEEWARVSEARRRHVRA